MSGEQEVDVLADLESQYDEGRQPVEDAEIIEDVEVIEDDTPNNDETDDKDGGVDDSPPGFMSYDEWIADGRDPDDFKGKKAYSQMHDELVKGRELEKEVKNMHQTLRATQDAIESVVEDRVSQERTRLQADLAQAKENDDVDTAIDVSNKLNDLDNKPAPQQTQQESPLIGDFRTDNPVLDEGSNQFDRNMSRQMQNIYNNTLRQLDDGTAQFSDADIKATLKASFAKVKELNPDAFESPRNTRQNSKPTQRRQTTKPNPGAELKNVKVERKNPRDNNAVSDVHQLLKDRVAADGSDASKKALENFEQNMTGA